MVPQPAAALVIVAPLLEAGGVRMSTHLAGHAGILAVARLLPGVPGLKYISGTKVIIQILRSQTSEPQKDLEKLYELEL